MFIFIRKKGPRGPLEDKGRLTGRFSPRPPLVGRPAGRSYMNHNRLELKVGPCRKYNG
jgi:hypothetical protein